MPTTIHGNLFLIKIGDGTTVEAFTTIGQLRATRLEINNTPVDITNKDSGGSREVAGDQAIKSYQITGDGIFDDAAAAERLRAVAETKATPTTKPTANFQIIDGTGDRYEGEFLVENWGMGSNQEDPVDYSCTLTSVGDVTRTADV